MKTSFNFSITSNELKMLRKFLIIKKDFNVIRIINNVLNICLSFFYNDFNIYTNLNKFIKQFNNFINLKNLVLILQFFKIDFKSFNINSVLVVNS